MVIDGKKIAGEIISGLKDQPQPKGFLAVFLIGDDAVSASFVKQKEKVAEELSVDFRLYRLSANLKKDDLRKEVLKAAEHKNCSGVIVQLPLPADLETQYVLNAIPREKDIDVLGERALGAFYAGRNLILPPACATVERILAALNFYLKDKKAAVIGRGALVGKPIALWLLDKVAECSVFTSQTENLGDKLKSADLVISGVGQADLFTGDDLKDDVLVVDFGYDFRNGKIFGDFKPPEPKTENLKPKIVTYTPTPGGTGPILVAELFRNFYVLDSLRQKK